RTIRTDVRIICATHQDLEGSIARGDFREDLYYRLNVVPIALPPLRARKDAIAELASHFLALAAEEGLPQKSLSASAIERLAAHGWPGNVRELQNIVRRMAALAREDVVGAAAVAQAMNGSRGVALPKASAAEGLSLAVEMEAARLVARGGTDLYEAIMSEVEPPMLRAALAATGGNQIKAAALLGINRNTLRTRLEQRGIDAVDFRTRS
ncbi:MAG: helix-turn-helix domain-containing protein, partial [Pacificimonas sp.]